MSDRGGRHKSSDQRNYLYNEPSPLWIFVVIGLIVVVVAVALIFFLSDTVSSFS